MIARFKRSLASLLADLRALITRSRIFILSVLGTLVVQWPMIADTITSFQPVADVFGHGDQARRTIAVMLFVGAAICRWQDHRSGQNPA